MVLLVMVVLLAVVLLVVVLLAVVLLVGILLAVVPLAVVPLLVAFLAVVLPAVALPVTPLAPLLVPLGVPVTLSRWVRSVWLQLHAPLKGGGDPAALRATAAMLLSKYGAKYGSDDTCITTVVEWLHGKQTCTRVPTCNEQCKRVSAVLEHLAGASLKFTPLQTHVDGWLSKAEETVVLLKVFSEVYDLGSLLNDRKIYDHILSRFPEKEYDHLGNQPKITGNPLCCWVTSRCAIPTA